MTIRTTKSPRAPASRGKAINLRGEQLAPAALPGDAIESAAATVAPRLLTPADVAEMLGVSPRTLERWRMTGEGPEYLSLTRQTIRYRREAVAGFVAARTRA